MVARAHTHVQAAALPLSNANSIPYLTQFSGFTRDRSFYLQKLFDHFDVYLGKLMEQIATQQISPNLVLIDFTVRGEKMGASMLAFDWYLRYKSSTHPELKKMIATSDKAPKLHFLAFYHPD